jgi:hypothetical protein
VGVLTHKVEKRTTFCLFSFDEKNKKKIFYVNRNDKKIKNVFLFFSEDCNKNKRNTFKIGLFIKKKFKRL